MLDSILAFSKKNSQSVIVALLGIIAAGSIAGSLRIGSLNDLLAERAVMWTQGKDLAEIQARLIQERAILREERLEFRNVQLLRLSRAACESGERLIARCLQHLEIDKNSRAALTATANAGMQHGQTRSASGSDEVAEFENMLGSVQQEFRQTSETLKKYELEIESTAGNLRLSYDTLGRLVVRADRWSRWLLRLIGLCAIVAMSLLVFAQIRSRRSVTSGKD